MRGAKLCLPGEALSHLGFSLGVPYCWRSNRAFGTIGYYVKPFPFMPLAPKRRSPGLLFRAAVLCVARSGALIFEARGGRAARGSPTERLRAEDGVPFCWQPFFSSFFACEKKKRKRLRPNSGTKV